MKRLLWVVLVSWVFVTAAAADYGPPLQLPNGETAADPMVLSADGVYYLYVTSSYVDFECWTSTDLVEWSYAGVVWEPKSPDVWNNVDIWAPEVHTDGRRFYLYYAASQEIGVAVADSPLGPFEDVADHPFVGLGYGNVAGQAIDAHVFQDEDGKRFFYFAGYRPFSTLCGMEMTGMTTLAEGTPETLVKPGIFNWELFTVEAPWMVKHDGRYYLMYSGWGANMPFYAVGYAVADNPLGPFTEYEGNPILQMDEAAGIWGPGHNCAVTAPDGSLKIVYHTKQQPSIGWDREIRVNDLCFTASGRMYVGLDGCDQQDEPDPSDDDDTDAGDDDANPPEPDDRAGDDDDSGCGD
ncbi:MAG: family 43 glycosylhydrolase [Myxococcales bacterium]|nr:family 43 glycosylhydrolase [Myxococcales bacterium]